LFISMRRVIGLTIGFLLITMSRAVGSLIKFLLLSVRHAIGFMTGFYLIPMCRVVSFVTGFLFLFVVCGHFSSLRCQYTRRPMMSHSQVIDYSSGGQG